MKKYSAAFPFFPKNDIDEILSETKKMLEGSKMLTMGEHVDKFENEFSKYCNVKYSVATNSCTVALELALLSLNLSSDDEVIVPVQTFIATGSCVLKAGSKIIFCDVDDDFLLDFESMKSLITDKTKVVIIVHFSGMISKNILEIKDYLNKRNIVLIEDAAHAHGASFNNMMAGSIGDIGCFSFYSTKIMTTCEGGMITTNNLEYYEKQSSIRNRGVDVKCKNEVFTNLGSNYRFTEFQALLGRYQLKRLEEFHSHRNKIATIYKKILNNLIKDKTIRIQSPLKNSRHAYWRFIVFLNKHNRDCVIKKLNELNIKTDAPYFPLLHNQPIFDDFLKPQTPNADRLVDSHISLPVHLLISEHDAQFIADKLIEVLK